MALWHRYPHLNLLVSFQQIIMMVEIDSYLSRPSLLFHLHIPTVFNLIVSCIVATVYGKLFLSLYSGKLSSPRTCVLENLITVQSYTCKNQIWSSNLKNWRLSLHYQQRLKFLSFWKHTEWKRKHKNFTSCFWRPIVPKLIWISSSVLQV